MRVLLVLVLVFVLVLALDACDALPDATPLVAGDTVGCAGGVFVSSPNFEEINVDAELVSVGQDAVGDTELTFDEGELQFLAPDDTITALLPIGPVSVNHGQAHCFGEGCPTTYVTLSSDDGAFFEGGMMSTLDDAAQTAGPSGDRGVHVVRGSEHDECPQGDGAATALLGLTTDDGDITLLPGEHRTVTIDGAAWFAAAGTATHREEVVDHEDGCADCASNGLYVFTELEALLVRVE